MANYADFELEISAIKKKYYGKVIRSPFGATPKRHQVQFKFSDPAKLQQLREGLEKAVLDNRARHHPGLATHHERVMQDFGREIFRSVFVDTQQINSLYLQSKGASRDLRIKLRIEPPELAGLPWEFLYEDGELLPRFISLRLPVVRYLETEGMAERMGVKGPLRILGMIADPATGTWPKLNVAKERDRINKGIDELQANGQVVLEWVPGGTRKDLMNKLLESEWHILHFIGHGGVEEPPAGSGAMAEESAEASASAAIMAGQPSVHAPSIAADIDEDEDIEDPSGGRATIDEGAERGFIVMLSEDGQPVKIFASDLATMLGSARNSLRLVVLNCCESATVNVGERFGNPAIGLMRTGWLPAVVAMQFPISDHAAITMSEGFYRALATNKPVDEAVTFARQLIQGESKIEWGIPVLYMRSDDGRIFDLDNPASPPAKSAPSPAETNRESLELGRLQFMLATESMPKGADELMPLSQRGQELVAQLDGDRQLKARVAAVYLNLGTAQQRSKEISKAAASFGYALKLNPRAEYFVRRANFYALVGFHENALADIAEALKLQPDNAEFYWIKGIVCDMAANPDSNRGFMEEAVKAFGIAIDKNPQEPKYLVSRAHTRVHLGRFDQALDDMDLALGLAPDSADVVAQRAKIAVQAGAR
jgi:tetratricopeptide (TPR) repeat protein